MFKAGLSRLKSARLIVEIIRFLTVKLRSVLQRCYVVSFWLLESSVIADLHLSCFLLILICLFIA